MFKKLLGTAVAALGLMAGSASAAPLLTVTATSGAATTSQSSASSVVFSGTNLAGWTMTFVSGITDATIPYIDLAGQISATGQQTDPLTLKFVVTGLTTLDAVNAWNTQFTGNIFNVTGAGSAVLSSYYNANNTDATSGAGVTQIGASLPLGSNITSAFVNGTTTFSLIEVMTLTASGSSRFSVDASVARVPEPATLALLGLGLLGLGASRRKQAA